MRFSSVFAVFIGNRNDGDPRAAVRRSRRQAKSLRQGRTPFLGQTFLFRGRRPDGASPEFYPGAIGKPAAYIYDFKIRQRMKIHYRNQEIQTPAVAGSAERRMILSERQ